MAFDGSDAGGGAAELEKSRLANPWLILGAVLFVIAFLLGWRSVAKKDDVR